MSAEPLNPATQLERSSWRHLLLSFRGRISRWTYVTRVFLTVVTIQLLLVTGASVLILLADVRGNAWLFRATALCILGLAATSIWVGVATLVKRLHDRRRSGWFVLFALVPLVNFWVFFEAMFLRGRERANPYGPPESEETSSRAVAIALGVVAFALTVFPAPIADIARAVILQSFNIPSGAEEPTLLIGDFLFVSKSAYGYSRYSFPFGLIPFSGRIFASPPTRGDIVVFKFPQDNSTDYVKRLIGLPGDRVQMKDGVLYINDKSVPKVKVDDYVEDVGGQPHHVPQYRETLPNGVSYEVLDREPEGSLDNTQVFTVLKGHYFMMGDNRDNSADSRVDVGYVPFENFVGKAEYIFYSTNGSARIWQIWKWPFAIRYDRIGRYIQ